MEQEGDGRRGGGGDMNKQPRDRRLKEIEEGDEQVQPQQQQQQPQKCPRCDSLNTKFCYYNNYSLTQPRYFCKTCRRYWTQGGTLRNVPVGGGCRKGKRAKSSSSSSSSQNSSLSAQPLPPPQKMVVQTQPTLTPMARARDTSSVVASPSISPFYQVGGGDGGYLSSLAAMNQLNPPSHPFDQALNVGGDAVMRSSNLGLLSGFNVASLGSQRQVRPSQFYQVGSGGRDQVVSLYASEQGLIPSSMAHNSSASTHHDWPQNFINNNASNRASDASLWSTISTTSIGGANSDRSAAAGSTPFPPNQWPDLPGFHPPS